MSSILTRKSMPTALVFFISTACLINTVIADPCKGDDGQPSVMCGADQKCCEVNDEITCCNIDNGDEDDSSVSAVGIVIVAIFGTLFAIVIGCSLCIICYLKRFGFPKHLFVGAAAPPTIEAVRAVEATPNNYDITDTVMMKMERYNRSFSVDDDIKYNVDSPPAYRNFIETPSSLQTDV